MASIDRRSFVSLAAASAIVSPVAVGAGQGDARQRVSATANPREWDQMLIVNALGGIANPNPVPDPEQRPAQETQSDARRIRTMVDERALRDAHASGITAVNVTLGYVAGPMEPFEYTVGSIAE